MSPPAPGYILFACHTLLQEADAFAAVPVARRTVQHVEAIANRIAGMPDTVWQTRQGPEEGGWKRFHKMMVVLLGAFGIDVEKPQGKKTRQAWAEFAVTELLQHGPTTFDAPKSVLTLAGEYDELSDEDQRRITYDWPLAIPRTIAEIPLKSLEAPVAPGPAAKQPLLYALMSMEQTFCYFVKDGDRLVLPAINPSPAIAIAPAQNEMDGITADVAGDGQDVEMLDADTVAGAAHNGSAQASSSSTPVEHQMDAEKENDKELASPKKRKSGKMRQPGIEAFFGSNNKRRKTGGRK